MKTIDPIVSDYIDQAIERERKIFNADMSLHTKKLTEENRRHMSALLEGFQHNVDTMIEIAKSKPDREEVREMIRDEVGQIIKPLDTKLSLAIAEIGEHRRELNKHDKRLTKLENVLV